MVSVAIEEFELCKKVVELGHAFTLINISTSTSSVVVLKPVTVNVAVPVQVGVKEYQTSFFEVKGDVNVAETSVPLTAAAPGVMAIALAHKSFEGAGGGGAGILKPDEVIEVKPVLVN